MSTRALQFSAEVLRREQLSAHLVRLVLGGEGLRDFRSTGIAAFRPMNVPRRLNKSCPIQPLMIILIMQTNWNPSIKH